MAGSGSALLVDRDRTYALVLRSPPCGVFSRKWIPCGKDDGLAALAILQRLYRDPLSDVGRSDSG